MEIVIGFAAILVIGFAIAIYNSFSNKKTYVPTGRESVLEKLVELGFNPEKTVSVNDELSLLVDDQSKRFVIMEANQARYDMFSYNNLLGFDVKQDNDVVSSGNMAGAVTGALLAGTAGAIIGSAAGNNKKVRRLDILLHLNSLQNSLYTLSFLEVETKTDSEYYKDCLESLEKSVSIFTYIMNNKE